MKDTLQSTTTGFLFKTKRNAKNAFKHIKSSHISERASKYFRILFGTITAADPKLKKHYSYFFVNALEDVLEKLLDESVHDSPFSLYSNAERKSTVQGSSPKEFLEKTGSNQTLPLALRKELLSKIGQFLPHDGIFYFRYITGKGTTRHAHDYVIEQSKEATSFYFLDPEDNVGKADLPRPRVLNYLALSLKKDEEATPTLTFGRYDTKNMTPESRKKYLHMESLFKSRKQFLTEGCLQDLRETQTYFQIHIDNKAVELTDVHRKSLSSLEESVQYLHAPLTLSTKAKFYSLHALLQDYVDFAEVGLFHEYSLPKKTSDTMTEKERAHLEEVMKKNTTSYVTDNILYEPLDNQFLHKLKFSFVNLMMILLKSE